MYVYSVNQSSVINLIYSEKLHFIILQLAFVRSKHSRLLIKYSLPNANSTLALVSRLYPQKYGYGSV